MFDLFKNEFNQYKNKAFLLMLLQLVVWGYISTQKEIMAPEATQYTFHFLYLLIVSMLFGALQLGLHKRKNHWTYLVHRPLPIKDIYKALIGAGLALIFIAMILPFMLVTITLDIFTHQVIDLRHYLFFPHIIAVSLSAYFLGTYVILNPNRAAITAVSLVFFYMVTRAQNSVFITLTADFMITLVLFYMSYASFKVNLSSHFKNKITIFLAVLIMQPLMIGLMYGTLQTVFYHVPLTLFSTHPDAYEKEDTKDSYASFWHYENHELVEQILEKSDYPRKKQLVAQVKLAKNVRLTSATFPQPFTHQLYYKDKQYALNDVDNKKIWVFSHDLMVFVGRHQETGKIVGYFGENGFFDKKTEITGAQQFLNVPYIYNNKFVKTHDKIYIVDFTEKLLELKHNLAEGEEYITPIQFENEIGVVAVLSNKGIYFFDPSDFNEENAYSDPTHFIPKTKDFQGNRLLQVTKLVDGYLIQNLSKNYYGKKKTGIGLTYVKHDGTVKEIAHMPLPKYKHPVLIQTQQYYMSPIIDRNVLIYLEGFLHPTETHKFVNMDNFFDYNKFPMITYITALFLMVFSALITFFLTGRLKMKKSDRIFWVIMNFIFSIGGLASFFFLNKWKGLLASSAAEK